MRVSRHVPQSSDPVTPPSAEVPSRYLVIGAVTYRDPSGRLLTAAYHTASARVFLLDVATAAALRSGAGVAVLDPGTRSRLAGLGLLVPAGIDETAAVVATGRTAAVTNRQRRFVIMPTAYCNMGCGYCGQRHRREPARLGAASHRATILARVTRAMTGGRYDAVQVRWFGGEPLMGFAVLQALSTDFVTAADQHGIGYSALLVTNGVLLDQRKLRELHLRCRVNHVEVTIDGTAPVHEAARPLKSGYGSFDRIVAALRAALTDPDLSGLRLSVRTNVGAHNAGAAREFASAMREAGLAHPRVTFYPAPVHSWGTDVSDYAMALRELAAVELGWYTAYVEAGLACAILPSSTRRVVCAATDPHSEVVAPDGRIYSCTEQPLVPGHTDRDVAVLTDLAPEQLRPAGRFDDWYDALHADETGCRTCRLLPVCGGACPKQWREGTAPCPPLKVNIADRLDLYARSRGLVPAA